jgi:8-oxo-dGTP diphosphatase
MRNILKKEILKLRNKKYVDQKILEKFLARLDKDIGLLRWENPKDHFCAFFLPVHQASNSIYLGHHIKANDWIPPGGHIEKDEHPLETIKREIMEELSYEIRSEKIELFDLTIKPIRKKHPCKRHWDLWYLIFTNDVLGFQFDIREFYDASWLDIDEALSRIKEANYNAVVKKLKENLFRL